MASSGGLANWSDITALYTRLNTARQKFNFGTIPTPTNRQGQFPYPSDISTLNNYINQMRSNANLVNVAFPVTVPTPGTLLQPLFVNTLSTTISNIQNANNFGNSSFGNSSFGNSSFGNSSFGNSSFNANSTFSNSSFGNSSFSNSSFSDGDSWFFGDSWCWG